MIKGKYDDKILFFALFFAFFFLFFCCILAYYCRPCGDCAFCDKNREGGIESDRERVSERERERKREGEREWDR